MKRIALFLAFTLIGLASVGCASATGPTTVMVSPGRYAQAFTATKDEIRRLGYRLARVDARGGVITSQTQSTAGFATPWPPNEASLGDRVDSFLHRDQRRILVSFDVADGAGAATPINAVNDSVDVQSASVEGDARAGLIEPGPVEMDRRLWEGELVCTVAVAHERLHRSGLRLSSAGVRLSNVTTRGDDPVGGQSAPIVHEIKMDTRLAAKLAQMIRDHLGRAELKKSAEPNDNDGDNDSSEESNP